VTGIPAVHCSVWNASGSAWFGHGPWNRVPAIFNSVDFAILEEKNECLANHECGLAGEKSDQLIFTQTAILAVQGVPP
jgi:hypothetical protein